MRTKGEKNKTGTTVFQGCDDGSFGKRVFGACIGERLCLDDVLGSATRESRRLIF
jgi:hypothetical protein